MHRSTILLNIEGESFLLECDGHLSIDTRNHIEAICECAYEEFDPELSVYEKAGLFQKIMKEKVGIDVEFKGIDLEVKI